MNIITVLCYLYAYGIFGFSDVLYEKCRIICVVNLIIVVYVCLLLSGGTRFAERLRFQCAVIGST